MFLFGDGRLWDARHSVNDPAGAFPVGNIKDIMRLSILDTSPGVLPAEMKHRISWIIILADNDEILQLFPGDLIHHARSMSVWSIWARRQMKLKLTQKYGVHHGFELFREAMGYPDSAHLKSLPLRSIREAATHRSAFFHLLENGGEPVAHLPPRVIGDGNHRVVHGFSRSSYVAAFEGVKLLGRSQLVNSGDELLLDYEGTEFDSIDDDIELDAAVFQREGHSASFMEGVSDAPPLRIDECFSLLGPNSGAFGHWVGEYLPRLAVAMSSGMMPDVPVLMDAHMPEQHRQSLALLLPENAEIIEIEPNTVVEVGKLWYSPTYYYAPILVRMNDRYREELFAAPLDRFARLANFMTARFVERLSATPGLEKIFLARRYYLHRKLFNAGRIEKIAVRNGFTIVYPEEHDFASQLNLIRNAKFVTGPEGSAYFLAFFARPGTKIAILNHQYTELLVGVTALLDELGMDTTVITGRFVKEDLDYPHHGDYRIDETVYEDFLKQWTADA